MVEGRRVFMSMCANTSRWYLPTIAHQLVSRVAKAACAGVLAPAENVQSRAGQGVITHVIRCARTHVIQLLSLLSRYYPCYPTIILFIRMYSKCNPDVFLRYPAVILRDPAVSLCYPAVIIVILLSGVQNFRQLLPKGL